MPTCYAPVRRAPSVLLQTRTRLACVKHAASVRSEPGSNSRLKPVAWAKKNAPIFIGASLPKQIIVARIYSIHPRSKTRMVSNRFWHIVSVVKERAPLSSRKAHPQPEKCASSPPLCQHRINVFHSLPQPHFEARYLKISINTIRTPTRMWSCLEETGIGPPKGVQISWRGSGICGGLAS